MTHQWNFCGDGNKRKEKKWKALWLLEFVVWWLSELGDVTAASFSVLCGSGGSILRFQRKLKKRRGEGSKVRGEERLRWCRQWGKEGEVIVVDKWIKRVLLKQDDRLRVLFPINVGNPWIYH